MPADFGFDFIEKLHSFNDAKCVALLNLSADFNKRIGAGARSSIESTDHRACYLSTARGVRAGAAEGAAGAAEGAGAAGAGAACGISIIAGAA